MNKRIFSNKLIKMMDFCYRIFIGVLTLALCFDLSAQNDSVHALLPLDSAVKIGKLENGFTYYIRANKKPEKRIEMKLAVNAGSILEDDDQLGVAHFVEHMSFNGTRHFEKNELVQYLQSIGIRFGPELNAFTSFDETVYMLTIPSDSVNLVEKGFLVMEDWAHNVSFDDTEIDKERGVIVEEWRLGRGPWQRMMEKYLPILFKDSRYAKRLPIGEKEIIENVSYETIRKFYKDWYRPDLMALIIVGDIDPEIAEKKIIEHFSSLQIPENPRRREEYLIPDQDTTYYSIATDVEAPVSIIRLIYKTNKKQFETYSDYLEYLKYTSLTGMLNRRLAELTENEDPPFISSSFQYSSLSARTKDGLQGFALVGEKGIERGLHTLLVENERLRQFGFTDTEFARYKLDLLKSYENAYLERDKTESGVWADEYVSHFLDNIAIPGIEFEYNFVKNNIDSIKLSEINDLVKNLITDKNRVIIVNAPQSEGIVIPTENILADLTRSVEMEQIGPYEDISGSLELITKLPVAGKIISEKTIPSVESVEIMLSNGIRVLLKPTDFKNDEILCSMFSMGGSSLYEIEDHYSAINADGIIQESGAGNFSISELRKILAGKTVYVVPTISEESENISAQTRASDLPAMFQLLYLYFTFPRIDESSFKSYITKKKDLYENLWKDPQNYFYDQYHRERAQNHPRGDYLPKAEDWDKINFVRSIEIYKDRFGDAGDFTFIMVGAFSIDSVKPLLEQYLGSLPSINKKENFRDLGIRPPNEKKKIEIYKGNDPKSLVIIYSEKQTRWNKYDAFMLGVLSDLLEIKYVEKLREEMSGVYHVRMDASLGKIPYEKSSMQIVIPCSPENVDSLSKAALDEIIKIQKSGVDQNDIAKMKETRRREQERNSKTNNYWLATMKNSIINNTGFTNINQEEYIDRISGKALKKVARKYLDVDNYLEMILYPEDLKKDVIVD